MRPRPESFLAPRYLDTGELGVGSFNLFAAEVAWVNDQFSLQGEYAVAHAGDVENISDGRTGRATMHGGYLQANYFLSGEHRIYNYEKGAFGQVYPNRNFGLRQSRSGPGAWEIAARLSRIDLDDGPVSGGIQTNLSLGLNWYLNPSIRTSLNFIHANVNTADVEGEANIIQLRFQLDFSPKGIGEFRPAHVINNLRSSGSK